MSDIVSAFISRLRASSAVTDLLDAASDINEDLEYAGGDRSAVTVSLAGGRVPRLPVRTPRLQITSHGRTKAEALALAEAVWETLQPASGASSRFVVAGVAYSAVKAESDIVESEARAGAEGWPIATQAFVCMTTRG